MKRTLLACAPLLVIAALGACGDGDDGEVDGPAVTPVATAGSSGADALSGRDLECKNEIVRQMQDPSQETQDTPPECQGISDDRLFELVQIADGETE